MSRYIARSRAVEAIRSWSEQDQRARSLFSQFIAPNQLCFDIGANNGQKAKVFHSIGTRLVVVEPQHQCVSVLRTAFGEDPRITIVEAACGQTNGRSEIILSTTSALSSMAQDWVAAVKATGRFTGAEWKTSQPCTVTTLDSLIDGHGVPAFIKIDVEGSELNVLRGLTQAVPCLSFEFTPEFTSAAVACVRYLTVLGLQEFNFSLGESMELMWTRWCGPDDLIDQLKRFASDTVLFGDVYARLATTSPQRSLSHLR